MFRQGSYSRCHCKTVPTFFTILNLEEDSVPQCQFTMNLHDTSFYASDFKVMIVTVWIHIGKNTEIRDRGGGMSSLIALFTIWVLLYRQLFLVSYTLIILIV